MRDAISADEVSRVAAEGERRKKFFQEAGLDLVAARRRMAGFLGAKDPVLDAGTGGGHAAMALAGLGRRVVSVDQDAAELRKACVYLRLAGCLDRVELRQMDVNRMEFEGGSFENILCVALIHHLSDPGKAFGQMDRVLAGGGRVVLSDFNARGFAVVDQIHAAEGGVHAVSGFGCPDAEAFFGGLNYDLERSDDEFHWVLVMRKPS
ncbi:MAG: class I SAM-dependent methyltransferase [Candidatus Omnitrophica bacterium]|nr:class I SAM-dependent methyltransferase [Candidatus Omnitrophota bacterium]